MTKVSFLVNDGSENREKKIREIARDDHTHAVVLAAIHFEWTIKRTILKLRRSPAAKLGKQLESVSDLRSYEKIWRLEIRSNNKRPALKTVLGKRITELQRKTFEIREKIVQGKDTVKKSEVMKAIDLYLDASKKLRDFATDNGENLD